MTTMMMMFQSRLSAMHLSVVFQLGKWSDHYLRKKKKLIEEEEDLV